MVEFNERQHEYRVDGVRVPSVTQIIQEIFLINFFGLSPEIIQHKANVGRLAHLATELYDQNDLDMETVDTALIPYLNGWVKFRQDTGFEPQEIELIAAHSVYSFAGRIDRVGIIGNDKVLLDIKTGVVKKTDCLQTAGYQILYDEGKKVGDKIKKRMAVYLRGDGTYQVVPHTDKTDANVFLSCLSIVNFNKRRR